MRVITDNRLAVAWRFGEPDISGNNRLKNLQAVKVAKVCGDGRRQIGPLVVHREKQAFDHQTGIVKPSDSSERVEQLGDAFERVVFTLNRNQQRLRGGKRV